MAIIALNDLKTYCNIPSGDTSEDAKLQILVDLTNVSIDQYVGRTLAETQYTREIYDGTGTEALCLRNYPISEVTEVLIAGVPIYSLNPYSNPTVDQGETPAPAQYSSYGSWYIQNAEDGILFHSICWPSGRAIVKVSYKAGYADIPPDIFAGALEMASFYRDNTETPGILSESLGSNSVTFIGTSAMEGGLTIPSILFRMVLDKYRGNYYPNLVY